MSDNTSGIRCPEPHELAPEEGWDNTVAFGNSRHRSFVSGFPESKRIRIAYYKRVSDGYLMGKVWFGPETQGPPGHVHGGAQAAVLDESMGGAAWMAGFPVVAAEIRVRFKTMMKMGQTYRVEAWVSAHEGRRITVEARLFDDQHVYSDSQGTFIVLPEDRLKQLSKQLVDPGETCTSPLTPHPSPLTPHPSP